MASVACEAEYAVIGILDRGAGDGFTVTLPYTISQCRSTQRCAAIFPVGGMKHSQDDPRRSLRSRSYGTTSSEK